MARSAGVAFIDLDRTALERSSGGVLAATFAEAGILGKRARQLQRPLIALFDKYGETVATVMLAERLGRLLAGYSVIEIEAVAATAAARLAESPAPWLGGIVKNERAQGRCIVMATSSPRIIAEPVAERFGFDGVIATELEVRDNTYTGQTLDICWGIQKRDAVHAWLIARDIDPATCSAYSDSIYDLPLLRLVGHPAPTNPDLRLKLVAKLAGWPVIPRN